MPTPELNPLLNPVLGQHMGRWAEVYFQSPPEKRDQAVLELLRELELENSLRAGAVDPSPVLVQEPVPAGVTAAALQFAEAARSTARCPNCGRINPATHRFCGMCGKPVTPQTASADLHISDLHVADLHVADLEAAGQHENQPRENPPRREPVEMAPAGEGRLSPPVESSYARTPTTQELPLFQSLGGVEYSDSHGHERERADDDIFTYPAARRSYRIYLGIALAVVIVWLGYMAWRNMQNGQSAHVEPQSPPPIATQPAGSEATSPATPTTIPAQTKPSTTPASSVLSPAEKARERRAARISAQKAARAERAKAKVAPPPAPAAAKSPETTPGTRPGSGAEEYAVAQSYLNGTNGHERNHAEAAKWLWKSVGKQNADATLALSDLYLKGDGVGKNCDQARVLLDSAARQGKKEAGDRLRHLPAFGCQ